MAHLYAAGARVVLGPSVDQIDDFAPGVVVKIIYLHHDSEIDDYYYTIEYRDGDYHDFWFVDDSEIDHIATEQLNNKLQKEEK